MRRTAVPEPTSVADILPLTPFQEGLVFHAGYDASEPDVYNVQFVFDLEGELDAAALHRAADALVRRHPALRAAFRRRRSGETVQLVIDGVTASWREIDLSGLGADLIPQALERLTAEDRTRRFDLDKPQSIRFTLVRHAPDQTRLIITNHHIVLDGWSMPILLT